MLLSAGEKEFDNENPEYPKMLSLCLEAIFDNILEDSSFTQHALLIIQEFSGMYT